MTMIMQGKTPRALGWFGFLGVLGLAIFMLPIMPTAAQEKAPPEVNQERAQEEVRKAEAQLKQAIQALETVKRTEAEKGTKKKIAVNENLCLRCHEAGFTVPKDMIHEKVDLTSGTWNVDPHGDVVKLMAEIEKLKESLHVTEARLKEAMKALEEQTRYREKSESGDKKQLSKASIDKEQLLKMAMEKAKGDKALAEKILLQLVEDRSKQDVKTFIDKEALLKMAQEKAQGDKALAEKILKQMIEERHRAMEAERTAVEEKRKAQDLDLKKVRDLEEKRRAEDIMRRLQGGNELDQKRLDALTAQMEQILAELEMLKREMKERPKEKGASKDKQVHY
jgi:hypothetical protein